MDFTIYINSQDVREYHRKIDYKNKKTLYGYCCIAL